MSQPPLSPYVLAPPPPPAHWWRRRQVGAPVSLIVVGAVLAGLFSLASFASSPFYFAVGMGPSLIAFGLGIWGCLWLDRWEPEPLRLVLLAVTWGGGLAIVASLILEILFMGGSNFVDSAIIAPLVEEAMKGAFVLFMLTGARRRQMNSITDHITYAALAGFAFAFTENLVYFSGAEDFSDIVSMAIIRTGFDMFGHPLATAVFSIGLWYARQRNNPLLGIAGFAGALFLHGAWNGAAVVGRIVGLVVVYLLFMVPTLIVVLRLATKGRKEEGQLLARYLPEMVLNGLIAPQEAAWIGDLKARGLVRASVASSAEGKAHVAYLLDAVVQLAHVRARFDAGRGTPALLAEQIELVNGIHLERAAAFGGPPPQPFVSDAPYAVPTSGWGPPAQSHGWPVPNPSHAWSPPAQGNAWQPPAQQTAWPQPEQATAWPQPRAGKRPAAARRVERLAPTHALS